MGPMFCYKILYFLDCDLCITKDYEKVKDFITEHWTHVDILINNAGQVLNKPFKDTSIDDFKKVYDTNVFGVSEMTRTVLPFMKKNSHVVTISSMGGIQGSMKFPGLSAYSSSKGAVITLSELLAEEYKETGPQFNVLALGAVQTEMLEEAFPGYKAPLSALEMAEYIFDFALTGNKFYNGKVLQVSNSTP
jgi:short-subunit dehydrogenase